jgi:hypothetical protein
MKSVLFFVCCINTRQCNTTNTLKQLFEFFKFNFILFRANFLTEEQVKTPVSLGCFMKACEVEEVEFFSFKTVELNGCNELISRISQLDPRKRTPVPIHYGVW